LVDSDYQFSQLGESTCTNSGTKIRKYKFKAGKTVYNVHVKHVQSTFYEVSFFRKIKASSNFKEKFGEVINGEFPGKVLYTCTKIAKHFLSIKPDACFIFLGFPCDGEKLHNTKRYRVYRKIASKYFDPNIWVHKLDDRVSSYLISQKRLNHPEELLTQVLYSFEFDEIINT
jgi:hypothetical protein